MTLSLILCVMLFSNNSTFAGSAKQNKSVSNVVVKPTASGLASDKPIVVPTTSSQAGKTNTLMSTQIAALPSSTEVPVVSTSSNNSKGANHLQSSSTGSLPSGKAAESPKVVRKQLKQVTTNK